MLNMFGYFFSKPTDAEDVAEIRHAYATWFTSEIPEAEFTGTDRLLFHYVEFLTYVHSRITIDRVLDLMSTDLRAYVIKHRIKVPGTEEFSLEDPVGIDMIVNITKNIMQDEMNALVQADYNVEDFPSATTVFFKKSRERRLTETYTKGFQMLQEKTDKRVGSDDAFEFTQESLSLIDEVYDLRKLEDIGFASTENSDRAFKFVCDSGIPTIDMDCGGIYTCQLFGIEAAPGVGKTRFASSVFAYRCAVVHRRNVLYFAIEQSRKEIECILVAHHIFQLYGLRVPDTQILRDSITDPDIKAKVATARFDLFDSGNYGKIYIVSGQLLLNTMVSRMKVLDRLEGPFSLIIVDYMFLLRHIAGSRERALDRTEIIRRGYQDFKAYLLKYGKSGLAVNQLNREGIAASYADEDIDETMAAGGIEVYRSTDYNIVLTRTNTMKQQGIMRIQNPKQRGSAGYTSFLLNAYHDVSLFKEKGVE